MEIDPYCKSAQEISELWQYLDRRLKRAEGGYKAPEEPNAATIAAHNRVFGRRAAQ
jgi:chromosome partitioning protein